jgi:hypothetical protein
MLMLFKLVENYVIVRKWKVSDDNAANLSHLKYLKKIQTEMTYPGQVDCN